MLSCSVGTVFIESRSTKVIAVKKSTKEKFRGSDAACGVLPYWECGIHVTAHDTRLCFSLVYGKRHPATQ